MPVAGFHVVGQPVLELVDAGLVQADIDVAVVAERNK
jgi:hypothetical protein